MRAKVAGARWPARATVHHVPLAADARPGQLDVRNAAYVLATLRRPLDAAEKRRDAGLATGKLQAK